MKKFLCLFLTLICFIISDVNMVFSADEYYDESGFLTYYYEDFQSTPQMTIPVIDKLGAVEIAKQFIDEYAPEIKADTSTDVYTVNYNKSAPYGYIITFPRIINNIVYDLDNVSFFVDSKTGMVVSYTKNFNAYSSVESTDNIISIQTAQEQYKNAMGIQLQYNKKIANNKIIPYLVYVADDLLINATTGNIIPSDYYIPTDGYFDVVNTTKKVSEYDDNEAIISIEQANLMATEIAELGITPEYNIASVDYLKNHDNTYLISLLYKRGTNTKEVTLNAKNGLLVEYSDNSSDIGHYKTKSPESFIENYYSEYCTNVIKRRKNDGQYNVFLYERTVNDIPYKSNGIYACFDDGKLTKLSFAWDNVEFPSAESVIDTNYIYQQFFKKNGLELTYYQRRNGELTPVYKKTANGTGVFDALSGRQLNYDGSVFYSAKELNYLDINNHYSGYAAKELSECDIYVSSGNVYLEDNISQQEYMLLISEFIKGTKPVLNSTGILTNDQREMLYAYMYEHNILERSETDYTAYVTRADAVKYFLRILDYGTIGDMSAIFTDHFDDSGDIPADCKGYVELAKSLGIVNGAYNNKFNPNDYITNGDSLIIIHNYLKTQE